MEKPPKEVVEAILELNRRKAAKDPAYFISNYLKTFDPRPTAPQPILDFKLYDFQLEYVTDLVHQIRAGEDVLVEKSRDMGISWVTLAVFLWFWLFEDGFAAHLGSRIQDYVDDGTAKSLFWKLEFMIRNIKDELLLPEGFSLKTHRTFMKLKNPVSGNEITGEAASSNFSRGGRYTVILMDEGGFWRDFESAWTAAGDSTQCRVLVTTPPNVPSYAKAIRFGGKVKVLTYLWELHPDKDRAWYERQKERRTEEEMLHEIDISWEYSSAGRPYPEVDKIQFGHFPYDPNQPLYLSLDLGRDAVAIGWWQPVLNSDWITLIAAYENKDKLIDWYVPFLGGDVNSSYIYSDKDLEFIDSIKYWKKPICYGDPSGRSRHIESERSPYLILQQDYNIAVQSNTENNDFITRRDETKRLLMRVRVNDTPGTRYWQLCVQSAHYPERKETSQATGEIVKPVHDWTSHHRTQTEFFAVNYRPIVKPTERRQVKRTKFHVG